MTPTKIRSLSQLFTLGIVLICVPLVAGTVLTFVYIKRLSDDSRNLVVRSLEIGRETEKLIGHIGELNRTARQYAVVGDKELFTLYTQKHLRLIDTLEWLEVLVQKKKARDLLDNIRSVSESAFDQMKLKSRFPNSNIDSGKFEKLVTLSDDLRFFSNTAIQDQLDMAARRVKTARVVLYWIWGVSSLLIVAFVVAFTWFIGRPIRRIDSHIRRLGQGDFERPITIRGPADIGELAARLDWLRTRLSEIDQIKERFFREMSHQLKTPLASIREGTGLLMDESGGNGTVRQQEVLGLLYDNSIELQRMLDNMLNFSAWRADPGNVYKECFDLSQVLETVSQRFRASFLNHGICIQTDCEKELMVEMDREKCKIILDNLISNAVKFSPEGGSISVEVSHDGSGICIKVSDEGPGVPPGEREKIFDLFYLRERPGGSNIRGTGVGLSLVRAYTEAHGGRVNVDSDTNGGACFSVFIPR